MSFEAMSLDDDCLVIPTKTALPMRCVQTNVEVSEEDYEVFDLPYIPRKLLILILCSLFFILFLPFIARRRCKFKAGLSQQVRRRYRLRKIFAGLLIITPIVAFAIAFSWQSEIVLRYAFSLFLPCFWAGFVIILLMTQPLKIVRLENELFWIRGCSSDYLASLQNPPAEVLG